VGILAWPLIVANISQTMLGVVDTAILGHLDDPLHLGGVAVGTAIFSFLFWGFGFLRMGTTGMTAQLSGAVERGAVDGAALKSLLARAAMLAIGIGIATIALREPLFSHGVELLGAEPAVAEATLLYTSIRVFGAPLVLINFVATGWLMGLRAPKAVLAIMVVTNLANVVLNLVFVLGLGMTVDGVALGSVLAEAIGLLLAVKLVRAQWRRLPGQIPSRDLFSFAAYRQLIAVNRDLFLRTLAVLGVFAFFTAEGARQGATVLAANAILLNFFNLSAHALDGFAQATEVMAGRALGGRDVRRFHAAVGAALIWCLGMAFGFAVLIAAFGESLIGLLTDLQSVVSTATSYLGWMIVIPLLAAVCFLMDGVFIGATRARAMRDTMVLSTFVIALPTWWLTTALGNHGLWLAFASFFAARSISLGGVYLYYSRTNKWLLNPDRDSSRPDSSRSDSHSKEDR
jgi:MATE family multidrug resistance protein